VKVICNQILSLFSGLFLGVLLLSGSLHYLEHETEEAHCTHNGEAHFHESPEPCGLCDYHFSTFHFSEPVCNSQEIPSFGTLLPATENEPSVFYTAHHPGRSPPALYI